MNQVERGRYRYRRGQTLVEFSLVAFMTVILLFFVVELGRMLLVYMTMANAARAGVRYAIVHGNTRSSGSSVDNASGPAADPAQVLTVVKNFASAGLLHTSLLEIHATYPDASNSPGRNVLITVVYPYDPLTTYFSKALAIRLGSSAQGVIVF